MHHFPFDDEKQEGVAKPLQGLLRLMMRLHNPDTNDLQYKLHAKPLLGPWDTFHKGLEGDEMCTQ